MGKTEKLEIEMKKSMMPLEAIPFITSNNIAYLRPVKAIVRNEYDEETYDYDIQVLPPILEKIILKEEHFKFVSDGNLGSTLIYGYRNGYYQLMSENQFKGVIANWIPHEIRKSKDLDEIYKLLLTENEVYITMSDLNTDIDYINFRNGLLNTKTMKLEPHTPDKFFTVQLPLDYKPLNECKYGKTFERYMEKLCDGDEIMYNTLLEIMGLVLSNYPGHLTKKCLLMYGKKDTGKSQLKLLLTKLLGLNYTSSVELSQLSKGSFATSTIYNKRLAGSNDLKYSGIDDMSMFKQLIGGDAINVEFKNKTPFPYVFTGFLWFLANDLPKFSGKKEAAIYERFVIMPCNNVVTKEERDPHIIDKMLEESEYIVSLCINHLKKLVDRKFELLESDRMKSCLEEYEIENNTLLQFVEECCVVLEENPKSDDRLVVKEFKRMYQNWCQYNNVKPIALRPKEMLYYLEPKYGTKINPIHGTNKFSNIKFKEYLDIPMYGNY